MVNGPQIRTKTKLTQQSNSHIKCLSMMVKTEHKQIVFTSTYSGRISSNKSLLSGEDKTHFSLHIQTMLITMYTTVNMRILNSIIITIITCTYPQ